MCAGRSRGSCRRAGRRVHYLTQDKPASSLGVLPRKGRQMDDQEIYDVRVRRALDDKFGDVGPVPQYRDISPEEAAGLVLAGEHVVVTAVYRGYVKGEYLDGEPAYPGDPVPGLAVWVELRANPDQDPDAALDQAAWVYQAGDGRALLASRLVPEARAAARVWETAAQLGALADQYLRVRFYRRHAEGQART